MFFSLKSKNNEKKSNDVNDNDFYHEKNEVIINGGLFFYLGMFSLGIKKRTQKCARFPY